MGTFTDPPPYADSQTSAAAPTTFANGSSINALLPPPPINPDTLLPATFKVGQYDAPPFITVPDMLAHLRLLGALSRLQERVKATRESEGEGGDVLDGETRWSVFCTRAEHSFEAWLHELSDVPLGAVSPQYWEQPDTLPGLEVLMVWHTYLLNPRRYYEDGERVPMIGRLQRLGFPLAVIARSIDPATLEYNPSRGEKHSTSTDSLPSPTNLTTSTFTLACPRCSTLQHVAWLQPASAPHGYCQTRFLHTCNNHECGLEITHEVLRVYKICRDLVALDRGQINFLPGLGLMPTTGELSGDIAGVVSKAILHVFKSAFTQAAAKDSSLPPPVPFTAPNIARHLFNGNVKQFENYLDANLKSGSIALLCTGIPLRRIFLDARINKLYAAYHHPGVASLALGQAVMRQAGFIGKMRGMGWLDVARFGGEGGGGGDVYLLQKAAARYHAFLDLLTTMPAGSLCPTLDIDLAWHTHQLKAEQYRTDTYQVTAPNNRFIDHDDKVSSTHLGATFDHAAAAWLARYKVPYSQCGCDQGDISALDGHVGPAATAAGSGAKQAIPQKLKFWNKVNVHVGGGGKKEERRNDAEKAIGGMQQGEKDASHPSVHNLVSVDIASTLAEKNVRLNKVKQLDSKAETLARASEAAEKHLALKRALIKDPTHPDPFVQDPPIRLRSQEGGKPAAGGSTSSGLPYWGVGVGAGLVSGGPEAWGLAITDPHVMKEGDCTRGGCAVGVGAGGGGYCSSLGGGRGACTGGFGNNTAGIAWGMGGAGCGSG
ncbi:hypothetical protein QFC21_007271 [Naganishia friedmannii]|uniref:Uncharacterized protein n=1 Tax=Naganishia friedmannii TaxID=89922 RepID=A0ACC2UWF0_9TREE|nr:hypothetical protein QFC21_007271 [Naganishia friedmannii]